MNRRRLAWGAAALVLLGLLLRVALAPEFDSLDDAGYLDAARHVSQGTELRAFPLFQLRVGMSYPLGMLVRGDLLSLRQFWVLTIAADVLTMIALLALLRSLDAPPLAAPVLAALYATYPLAVQQATIYYPTAFQVAAIAVGLALLARAGLGERGSLAVAYGGGVAIGLGYLVKEDVALVVPAMMVAGLLAGWPRWRVLAAFATGAAAVFTAECAAYWITTGHPLARLAASSGLAAQNMSDALDIAAIWRWHGYLRSLFATPINVGLLWWLAIPAAVAGFRAKARPHRFLAWALVLLCIYLQFGSASFRSYVPLPKTPRYSSIATPFVITLVATWLAAMLMRRRRRALALVGAVVAVNLLCIAYLSASSGERTRNTLAALPVVDTLSGRVYTDYYGARILRLLTDGSATVEALYHADFIASEPRVLVDPATLEAGSFVLLDRQSAKVYTSSYGMLLPSGVTTAPPAWEAVWHHRAYPSGSATRYVFDRLRTLARLVPDNPISRRVVRNVADMIDHDDATLYRVR